MKLEEVLPLSLRDLLALPRPAARAAAHGRAHARRRGAGAPLRPAQHRAARAARAARDPLALDPPQRAGRGCVDAVCVAATQIGTGHVTVFIETRDRALPRWTPRPDASCRGRRACCPTHALASAAIPRALPRRARREHLLRRRRAPAQHAARARAAPRRGPRARGRAAPESGAGDARRRSPSSASGDYGSPLFLFGKVLNALLLDHIDTDLARMRVMNEILLRRREGLRAGLPGRASTRWRSASAASSSGASTTS